MVSRLSRRLLLALLALVRAVEWLFMGVVSNARELLFAVGLAWLHVGLRASEPFVPGIAAVVPATIVIAIAVFGVRGGRRAPRGPQER